jgi:hypothetical protein
VLDAVAEADATQAEVATVEPSAEVAVPDPPAAAAAPEAAAPEAPAEAPAPEAPAPEAPAPEAVEATPEAPGTDEEVSLEAILEDLKRREGRSE